MPSVEEHVTGLTNFLLDSRRERFVSSLLGAPKNRRKEVNRLAHLPYVDSSVVWRQVPLADVLGALPRDERLTPEAQVYVVSDDIRFDGAVTTLDAALAYSERSFGSGLISVVPGEWAVFVAERPSHAQVLHSPSRARRA